jgi:hypothetical protein
MLKEKEYLLLSLLLDASELDDGDDTTVCWTREKNPPPIGPKIAISGFGKQ